MEDRLQKLLSAAGVCSRRRAEEYITAGRVTVNGRPASLGDRADPDRDEIALDGQPVVRSQTRTVLMLYKPRGVVTTLSDEKGRRTVADLVKGCPARVWPVGRLDLDSEGLLLLTDDGDLTNALIHPRHEVEKEYLVWVTGCTEPGLGALARPMKLDGQALRPAQVAVLRREGERTVLSVVIHEGKNRQIRRMCAACGMTVRRLKRVREGSLTLDRTLAPGQWRPLTPAETARLKEDSFLQE
ncbi:pseudouridine synthase [Evtepia sp.]|uniref:pseudouridine synthase n=1 Tax=Evtepia sp. TaxID=2773933 RepID=UPI002A7F414B|nr:pseudouridine synthase [Evtepia sp.]MDY3992825.1 pseudouridine synthase [Evtepia sp.]MDY4430971.1 pseudouridine synthase [Evtepia sp.]